MKLRKRPPFWYSMANLASSNLSQIPYQSYSREPRASPKRLLRPAEVDILKPLELSASSAQIHPQTQPLPHPDRESRSKPDNLPLAKPERRTSPDTQQNRVARGAYRNDQGALPHHTTAQHLPYDGASRLAESYRSLLPDPQTINYTEIHTILRRQKSMQTLRNQTNTGAGLGERRPRCVSEFVTASRPQERPHSHTASSDTEVNSDTTQVEPWTNTTCQQTPETGESSKLMLDSADGYQFNDVGLQICFDLLTDELCKACFRRHPREESYRASKLQILLMIEAYETVLAKCRRRMSEVGNIGGETSNLQDAEQALNHWLDSLYSIYPEGS